MLAKVWKKALLAICIVACIYNVMSKIINRHSLEENLRSANNGETVFDFSKKEEKEVVSAEDNDIEAKEDVVNDETENEESEVVQDNTPSKFLNPFTNLDFLFQNT